MASTRTAPPTPEQQTAAIALDVISHHEAAHAVAALRLSGQVLKIRLWQKRPNRWEGLVTMRFRDDADGNRAAATALLVGVPTELRWMHLHRINQAALPHDVWASGGPDRDEARDSLTRIPRRDRPTFREIEREAVVLVDRCWDRIEHLAARLAASHQLQP
ncbi:hypothetical protein [Umezawaea sp. Da 62-37]|uniref:hypothetical protein n=1 Tax=Umezawaea sp. Da 62-37 TaxID=3075927 RepID=UPI0028F6E444|nr:hypothetical protein [Umezawaea sp. Da 62-37]WNV83244.1 hypothetical protein RM788_34370 [Umezawaea sp. Da 62-37]